jgi:hypothetical protein
MLLTARLLIRGRSRCSGLAYQGCNRTDQLYEIKQENHPPRQII